MPSKPNNSKVLLLAVAITSAILLAVLLLPPLLAPKEVYLNASPYNRTVDMSLTLSAKVGDPYVSLADRTRCAVVSGKAYYKIDSGPPIPLYMLRCEGKVGYVHADRVSRF